jgi:hypothetical protein
VDYSNLIQNIASLVAIFAGLREIIKWRRKTPIELVNRWRTHLANAEEIVVTAINSNGGLALPWTIREEIVTENSLRSNIHEIYLGSRNRKIRELALTLEDSLRKLWAATRPKQPNVYSIDSSGDLQSGINYEGEQKFRNLQIEHAEQSMMHIAELRILIEKNVLRA